MHGHFVLIRQLNVQCLVLLLNKSCTRHNLPMWLTQPPCKAQLSDENIVYLPRTELMQEQSIPLNLLFVNLELGCLVIHRNTLLNLSLLGTEATRSILPELPYRWDCAF